MKWQATGYRDAATVTLSGSPGYAVLQQQAQHKIVKIAAQQSSRSLISSMLLTDRSREAYTPSVDSRRYTPGRMAAARQQVKGWVWWH
jgi:hypothetical protein